MLHLRLASCPGNWLWWTLWLESSFYSGSCCCLCAGCAGDSNSSSSDHWSAACSCDDANGNRQPTGTGWRGVPSVGGEAFYRPTLTIASLQSKVLSIPFSHSTLGSSLQSSYHPTPPRHTHTIPSIPLSFLQNTDVAIKNAIFQMDCTFYILIDWNERMAKRRGDPISWPFPFNPSCLRQFQISISLRGTSSPKRIVCVCWNSTWIKGTVHFFLFVSDRQVQVAAVAMECLPSKRGHSADADRLDEPQRRREQHVSDLRRWHPDAQSDVSQTKRFSTCQPSTLSRSHPLTHGSTVSNACLFFFFFFFFFPLSSEPTLSIKRFD